VSTITNWSAPTDWQTVCARAGGRRRWNAVKKVVAYCRRGEGLQLLHRFGWRRGTPALIARTLGVHRSTVSRDLKVLFPALEVCEACGHQASRAWWEEV
jgi:hypothetical protein